MTDLKKGWLFAKCKVNRCLNEIEDKQAKELKNEQFYLYANLLNKFEKDHIVYVSDKRVIVNDGVILNSKDLYSEKTGLQNYLLSKSEKEYFTVFRGPFSGFLFDISSGKLTAYTNHTGEKSVYYYEDRNLVVISSSMWLIKLFFDRNHISYSFNERAANSLMTYYHLNRDDTIMNEVHKLLPGHYVIHKDKLSINCYWKLKHKINKNITRDEAIDKIDELFTRAVRMEFDKDREYGYRHFVTLSGGLDSRMTCMVAHEMGYTDQIAFHMGDGRYYEEGIARNIALDLGIQYIFKMNNDAGGYMCADDWIKASYGQDIIGSGDEGFVFMNHMDWSTWGGVFIQDKLVMQW